MKHKKLSFRPGFRVGPENLKSQCAVMVLAAGSSEGGSDNSHRGADQWLYVVEGHGAIIVNGRRIALSSGAMVLIEAGDTHEIRNTGRSLLKTVSLYVPPAYDDKGEALPRGEP